MKLTMKFAFYTLGCKVNQYETQAMERLLQELGHEIGSFEDDCHGYIINTCSVTAVADKKNRAVIRRCRRSHPDAIIAVCGCYTQHAPEAARELGVDVLGGSGGREEFLQDLLAAVADRQHREHIDAALRRRENAYDILTDGAKEGFSMLLTIAPALIVLLGAVGMLRSSGALEALSAVLSPALKFLGIPAETVLLLLIRPLSGSAALAVGAELMAAHGPDSLVGRTAAVMLGSTETTFYTVSVYFGACGVKKTRYAIPAALIADVVGFLAASWSVRMFFS